MTYEPREFRRVRNALLLVSATAWALLLFDFGGTALNAHCDMMAGVQSPAALAFGWSVMLAAMMTPALIAPVCHIRLRSLTRRRTRAAALFLLAYAAVWMALGCGLLSIGLAAASFAPLSWLPALAAGLAALVWQASPWKQRCLNACHADAPLATFGAAADYSVIRYGLKHAIWCAGSCWALMLLPMLLLRWHLAAMALVTLLISAERFEPPARARWRLRGLHRVTRIAVAQGRIRMKPALTH